MRVALCVSSDMLRCAVGNPAPLGLYAFGLSTAFLQVWRQRCMLHSSSTQHLDSMLDLCKIFHANLPTC